MNEPIDTTNNQVVLPSALEAQSRAEYDVSIVTAHRFPRSVSVFLKKAESMATATPEIAEACEFAKPVGGDFIKGPSVRLAEIVAATYGNLRVQARIIAETDTEVVAQGVAHDLESNVAHSTEVSVSIVNKYGKRYGADQIQNCRGSACAKARRNATFLVVPLALCLPVISAARKVAAGKLETLPERRRALLDWFEKGAKIKVILEWLQVKDQGDIGLEEMADLIAARNAAKDDGVALDVFFSRPRDDVAADLAADNFGQKNGGGAPAAKQTNPADPRLVVAITAAMSNGLKSDKALGILLKHGGLGATIQDRAAGITADRLQACLDEISAAAQEGA